MLFRSQDTLKIYYSTYEKLLIEKNDEPTIEEISCDCGISVLKLNKAIKFGIFTVSSLCYDNNDNFDVEDERLNMDDVIFTVSLEQLLDKLELSDVDKEIISCLLNNEDFDYNSVNMSKKDYEDKVDKLREILIVELWNAKD